MQLERFAGWTPFQWNDFQELQFSAYLIDIICPPAGAGGTVSKTLRCSYMASAFHMPFASPFTWLFICRSLARSLRWLFLWHWQVHWRSYGVRRLCTVCSAHHSHGTTGNASLTLHRSHNTTRKELRCWSVFEYNLRKREVNLANRNAAPVHYGNIPSLLIIERKKNLIQTLKFKKVNV